MSKRVTKSFPMASATALAVLLFASAASAGTGVWVNGIELNPQQLATVVQTIGQVPARGHYFIEGSCVMHLESGEVACADPAAAQGGYQEYGGGAGGGYGHGGGDDGSWFHRGSDASGGYSVGGDGSGCIYTPDWSNC